jgi:hypothetical protein
MCSEIDIRFDTIVRECIYLTQFATQLRYPHEVPITEYNVAKSITDAETVSRLEPIIELRAKFLKSNAGSSL